MSGIDPKNSDDPEIWEALVRLKKARQALRQEYGAPCAECVRLLPKAHPSKMLPGQSCKIHGWKDPRPRLTPQQIDDVFERFGFARKDVNTAVDE